MLSIDEQKLQELNEMEKKVKKKVVKKVSKPKIEDVFNSGKKIRRPEHKEGFYIYVIDGKVYNKHDIEIKLGQRDIDKKDWVVIE